MANNNTPMIYCIGRNYADHIAELNNDRPKEPLVFLKSPASLRGLNDKILAFAEENFHYEAEVVVVASKDYQLHETATWQDIKHLALGIDLTRRSVQTELKNKGLPWTLAKSFFGSSYCLTFCCMHN